MGGPQNPRFHLEPWKSELRDFPLAHFRGVGGMRHSNVCALVCSRAWLCRVCVCVLSVGGPITPVKCENRRHCQTTLGDFRPRGSVIGGEPATEGPPTKNLECRLAVSSVSTLRAQFRTGRRHEEFLNVYVCVVACCLWVRAVCGCLCVLRYVRQTTVSSLPSQQQLHSHGSSQTCERG